MTPKQVPAELIELVKAASPPADRYSAEAWARTILAAALPAHSKQVRTEVAEGLRGAAKAIVDSRGENADQLAEEIWRRCGQSEVHPATLDDPRTIAEVAYTHIADRIARGGAA